MRVVGVAWRGLGAFIAAPLALAFGCVGEGAAPVDAARQADTFAGCPEDAPVSTMNYAPPHAYPGNCGDGVSPAQDGAYEEMMQQCQQYCGQSASACGAEAHLRDVTCIDRDIGHRWGATCVCGGEGDLAPGGGGFGGTFPSVPPGGAVGGWFGQQPGWSGQGSFPGAFPVGHGAGWQPPPGWQDGPHEWPGSPPLPPEPGNGWDPSQPGWGR